MAKAEKKQTFELSTLNSDNLVELKGFEVIQKQLVVDNPFQAITDNKTFEIAKQRRTALKTGRTKIQNQDKTIGSILSSFRKGTIEIAKNLIGITKEAEEKQQLEIDRFQEIKDEEKRLAEQAEEIRIQKIKDEIDRVKIKLNTIIEDCNFSNLKQTHLSFDNEIEFIKDYNFQEFEFLFDEMIEEKINQIKKKVEEIKEEESQRIEQLSKDQQSKINEIKLECLELIENSVVATKETLIKSLVDVCSVEYEFGINESDFIDMRSNIMLKAKTKIEWLTEQEDRLKEERITIQKNKVINIREALLDLVHQLTVYNYENELPGIEEPLKQDFKSTVPEAMEEVQKLKDRVNEALKRKLEEIAGELKTIREKEEAEEKRMEGVMKDRISIIEKLGMSLRKSGTEWIGFGLKISDERLYEEDDIQTIIDEIKDFKKADQKEKSRQKRLNPERKILINYIGKDIRFPNMFPKLKEKEMIEFKKHFESELNALCDSLIETLKSK